MLWRLSYIVIYLRRVGGEWASALASEVFSCALGFVNKIRTFMVKCMMIYSILYSLMTATY